jgi:hypothetical protein
MAVISSLEIIQAVLELICLIHIQVLVEGLGKKQTLIMLRYRSSKNKQNAQGMGGSLL